jgi:hypothetical protein
LYFKKNIRAEKISNKDKFVSKNKIQRLKKKLETEIRIYIKNPP